MRPAVVALCMSNRTVFDVLDTMALILAFSVLRTLGERGPVSLIDLVNGYCISITANLERNDRREVCHVRLRLWLGFLIVGV